MTTDTTNPDTRNTASIECDEFLQHPIEKVWAAITQPETIARWWAAADGFRPEAGHEFTIDMDRFGVQRCTVLEVDEPRLIRYTFAEGVLDSTLTWRLEAEGTGTRLFLTHGGLDQDSPMGRQAFEGMGRGWQAVLTRIASVID
jgi:uncharacterized protein YndB with AHSA1/START domain